VVVRVPFHLVDGWHLPPELLDVVEVPDLIVRDPDCPGPASGQNVLQRLPILLTVPKKWNGHSIELQADCKRIASTDQHAMKAATKDVAWPTACAGRHRGEEQYRPEMLRHKARVNNIYSFGENGPRISGSIPGQ